MKDFYLLRRISCGFPKLVGVPFAPIMENQMEKKMENEMETGIIQGIVGFKGFPKIRGPHNKDHNILGSILGSP